MFFVPLLREPPLLISIALNRYHAGEGHFPAIIEWMTDAKTPLRAKLAQLLQSPDPMVQAGAARTLDQSDRMRACTWTAALEPLTLFQDPIVAQHTTKSEWFFETVLGGLDPSTLYLECGAADMARLGSLFGALIDLLMARLTLPTRLPRHAVLLALHPATLGGHVPVIEHALSGRGKGAADWYCYVFMPAMRPWQRGGGEAGAVSSTEPLGASTGDDLAQH